MYTLLNKQAQAHINNLSKGCTARKIWMVSRHGTRYPSGNDFNKLYNLPEVNICSIIFQTNVKLHFFDSCKKM